jgi:hypothetical protein
MEQEPFKYELDDKMSQLLNAEYPPLLQAIQDEVEVKLSSTEHVKSTNSMDEVSLETEEEEMDREYSQLSNSAVSATAIANKGLIFSLNDTLIQLAQTAKYLATRWLSISSIIRSLLPQNLRDEIDFLSEYINHCWQTGEHLNLPYLFPSDFVTDHTGAVVRINRPISVFVLRSLARSAAGVAVTLLPYVKSKSGIAASKSAHRRIQSHPTFFQPLSSAANSPFRPLVRGVPSTVSSVSSVASNHASDMFRNILSGSKQVCEPDTLSHVSKETASSFSMGIDGNDSDIEEGDTDDISSQMHNVTLASLAEQKRALRRATLEIEIEGHASSDFMGSPRSARRPSVSSTTSMSERDLFRSLGLSNTERNMLASLGTPVADNSTLMSVALDSLKLNTSKQSEGSPLGTPPASASDLNTTASDLNLTDSFIPLTPVSSPIPISSPSPSKNKQSNESPRVQQQQISTSQDTSLEMLGDPSAVSYLSMSTSPLGGKRLKDVADLEWEEFRIREAGIPEEILRLEFEAIRAGLGGNNLKSESNDLDAW